MRTRKYCSVPTTPWSAPTLRAMTVRPEAPPAIEANIAVVPDTFGEIRVYVDGHIAITTLVNTDRPDVSKAFPQYARGSNRLGWTTSIVFDTPGPHTIIVQAVDSDGATRDIGTLAVTSLDQ